MDAYVESGFSSIFLRPISPFGLPFGPRGRQATRLSPLSNSMGVHLGISLILNLQGIIIGRGIRRHPTHPHFDAVPYRVR